MFHARLVPIQSRSIRDFFFVHPTYTHRITISDNTLVFSLRFLVADRKRFLIFLQILLSFAFYTFPPLLYLYNKFCTESARFIPARVFSFIFFTRLDKQEKQWKFSRWNCWTSSTEKKKKNSFSSNERKCNNEEYNAPFNRERQVISSLKARVMHATGYHHVAILGNYFPLAKR